MAAPTNVEEFLTLVRKSGLIEEPRLDAYLHRLATVAPIPADPRKLAGMMIRDGLATYFQAEQFLLGKWRGFTIGKYKLLERIGFGGMGQVFLCEHMYMRRRVAIKVLPPAKAEEPAALGRFYREARAAGILDHPNIVRTHDIDQDGPLHFLVMEYVDGASFLDIVKKFGAMDVLRATHYTRQAAVGLQHAHKSGIIHRDVKPGNVLVDREGVVKILDMGLARFYHDSTDMLTLKYDERSVLGTADYVAPEQTINSHDVDIRADIYGLGCTFYFLLAGHPPFPDGTVAQKLLCHQAKMPTPIRQLRPEVPEGLAQVLETMLAKDPRQRYQTPQEAADALAPFTTTPIPPPPEGEMPKLSPAATDTNAGGVPPAAGSGILGRDSGLIPAEAFRRPPDPALSGLQQTPSSGIQTGWPTAPGGAAVPVATPVYQSSPARPSPSDNTPITRPASLPAFAIPANLAPLPAPPRRPSSVGTVVMVLLAGVVGAGAGMFFWSQKGSTTAATAKDVKDGKGR
jgi:serine/threonine protein kinase